MFSTKNCTKGSAPQNKRDSRALDNISLNTNISWTTVQNQNNFTEMNLMLPSTKIDQMVFLYWTTWLPELKYKHFYIQSHLPQATASFIYVLGLRWATQGPRAFLFVLVVKKSVWINIKCILNFFPNYILYLLLEHLVAHKECAVQWCMPCHISSQESLRSFQFIMD